MNKQDICCSHCMRRLTLCTFTHHISGAKHVHNVCRPCDISWLGTPDGRPVLTEFGVVFMYLPNATYYNLTQEIQTYRLMWLCQPVYGEMVEVG